MSDLRNLLKDVNTEQLIERAKYLTENVQPVNLNNDILAKYIDHTLLKPDAKQDDILKLCNEAKDYGFYSVCVNPIWVEFCFNELKSTDVKVCSVVGFPLGSNKTDIKYRETELAISDGAEEIDMVINVGKLKSKDFEYVFNDIKKLADLTKSFNSKLKVIIETCLLTDEEKIIASVLSKKAGADFVKTSTGFSSSGANLFDVTLMKLASDGLEVKASGGIKSRTDALKFISAGATRLGTSSGIKILNDETITSGY